MESNGHVAQSRRAQLMGASKNAYGKALASVYAVAWREQGLKTYCRVYCQYINRHPGHSLQKEGGDKGQASSTNWLS